MGHLPVCIRSLLNLKGFMVLRHLKDPIWRFSQPQQVTEATTSFFSTINKPKTSRKCIIFFLRRLRSTKWHSHPNILFIIQAHRTRGSPSISPIYSATRLFRTRQS